MSQPAARKRCEIGDRRLGAGQDDEVGVAGQRLARRGRGRAARRAPAQADRSRRNWRCAPASARRWSTAPVRARGCASVERDGIFGRQARGVGEERQEAERGPAGAPLDRPHARRRTGVGSPRNLLTMKPAIIAASSARAPPWCRRCCAITPPRSMSPTSDDRHVRGAREAHIGDVAVAQIDLGGAARAFDEHEVGVRLQPREAVEHARHAASASSA